VLSFLIGLDLDSISVFSGRALFYLRRGWLKDRNIIHAMAVLAEA